jgi:hypothetical protein
MLAIGYAKTTEFSWMFFYATSSKSIYRSGEFTLQTDYELPEGTVFVYENS